MVKDKPTKHPMQFERKRLPDAFLKELYLDILYPRMIEEKMLILLRQGRISKWFSGIGQEGIAVGLTKALEAEDYILPLHRNLGVFTTRNIPLENLIGQWLGKPSGFTNGRDRSFHFGLEKERIFGMISHLGAMLPVANGLTLASLLSDKQHIAAAFSGDGGTSEGEFHEALNIAAVWKLPVIFVVENNGYGLSTPTRDQYACERLSDRAKGYGMKGYTIQGNNVLTVYHKVKQLAKMMRKDPQPILLELETFRMRGHEEASGTKYVPQELFDQWEMKDPVKNFEAFLLEEKIIDQAYVDRTKTELKKSINHAVEKAWGAPLIEAKVENERTSIYAPSNIQLSFAGSNKKEMRFVDAISDGLQEAMNKHPELVLMGQDIGDYGGVFKITQGFVEKFGKDRVRNTPLCESGIVGTAMGLSLGGKKAMVEMQFADFVSCGFNQIVNNIAKNHYRWGHAPDVVIRMPTGGGMGAGPFHSQSNESWFAHVPGLKIVFPSSPEDAKGLLISAFDDPNPVMFFEHKGLYRSQSGMVPEGYYHVPIGKAKVTRPGEQLTLVSYGLGVIWAKELAEKMPEADIEIIDLRSLVPWDRETVFASVRKTGKCIVLYEDTYTGAFGAEIAASISEHCFEALDGPVVRVGSLDTPVPFHPHLEEKFMAKYRLEEKVMDLLGF